VLPQTMPSLFTRGEIATMIITSHAATKGSVVTRDPSGRYMAVDENALLIDEGACTDAEAEERLTGFPPGCDRGTWRSGAAECLTGFPADFVHKRGSPLFCVHVCPRVLMK
jgi:hypothetical protein